MADLEFDFSGTRELYKWIEGFNGKFNGFIRDFTKESGIAALAQTKELTPVGIYYDDVAFWARKSKDDSTLKLVELWGAGEGLKGGTLRRSWNMSRVEKNGSSYGVTIYTNVNYAPYVEIGHRKAAFNTGKPARIVGWWEGRHMARDGIQKVQDKIPEAYEIRFKEFIRSLGVTDA